MRKIPYIVILVCIVVGVSFGFSVFGDDSSVRIIESRENSSDGETQTSASDDKNASAFSVSGEADEGADASDAAGADDAVQDEAAGNENELIQDPVPDTNTGTKKSIWIYVCGAVREPDVYELPEGSRVYEAVEAAGGLTEDAQPSAVNQALILHDQEQLKIPTVQEAEGLETDADISVQSLSAENLISVQTAGITGAEAESAESEERININTAGEELLTQIPGIGKARAASIISYRESNGRFESIEDIMKVSGIKQASFDKLKDYITVGP